jgi:lysozyme
VTNKLNSAGLALIKEFEGCELTGYGDATGTPTAGYGHTGADVTIGAHYTQEQADKWLKEDVARFELAVGNFCPVLLTSNQFAALVSFAYNVRGWKSSTLFKYICAKKYAEAAEEFEKWTHAGGKVLKGLERRRAAEKALFLKP